MCKMRVKFMRVKLFYYCLPEISFTYKEIFSYLDAEVMKKNNGDHQPCRIAYKVEENKASSNLQPEGQI